MGRISAEHRHYYTEMNLKAYHYCLVKQIRPDFVFSPEHIKEIEDYLKKFGGFLETKTLAHYNEAKNMKTLKQVRVFTGGECENTK